MIADEGHNRPDQPYSPPPIADRVFRAVRMGSSARTHESVSDHSKINLSTPLLAAEGFLILTIQIQGEKSVVKSMCSGRIADRMGDFA
jgi:hypothetical protein